MKEFLLKMLYSTVPAMFVFECFAAFWFVPFTITTVVACFLLLIACTFLFDLLDDEKEKSTAKAKGILFFILFMVFFFMAHNYDHKGYISPDSHTFHFYKDCEYLGTSKEKAKEGDALWYGYFINCGECEKRHILRNEKKMIMRIADLITERQEELEEKPYEAIRVESMTEMEYIEYLITRDN